MKELLQGFLELIGSIIITVLIVPIGILYSLFYSIWLTLTLKKWYALFAFWWIIIEGVLSSIGYLFHSIAYFLDLIWNVTSGELIEDCITAEEHTEFRKKNTTVSASTGKLEIEGKLNKAGKKFSKFLNVGFSQKRHAIDAWNFLVALRELKKNYFN